MARQDLALGRLQPALEKLERVLTYVERAMQQERLYRVRSQKDPALAIVRDAPSAPDLVRFSEPLARYRERFAQLLTQYQPPALGGFGARLEATFDPAHFSE